MGPPVRAVCAEPAVPAAESAVELVAALWVSLKITGYLYIA